MKEEAGPIEIVSSIRPELQNLLHIPMFSVLAILWLQALQLHAISVRKKLTLAFLLSSLIGVLNEFIQIAVPGRYPSSLDVIFNTLGSLVGVFLYYWLLHRSDSFVRRLVCE
jgi:VanZ family protein